MARISNLNSLLYFEAVARLMRVNLAAEELNVSPSAVSQQVKLLEEQLGVTLYRRVKNRLVLTEEGERLHSLTATSLRSLQNSVERVALSKRHDSINIRSSPSIGARWLAPGIHSFADTNPAIDLHIDATSELTDFNKESVDIEIRYGAKRQADIVSELLITDHVLPLATPEIAAKARQIGLAELFRQTRFIQTVKAEIPWETWLERHGFNDVTTTPGLRFDRSFMSLSAARNGFGIVIESAVLAAEELEAGSLVPLAPELGGYLLDGYWLNYPSRHLNRRVVRLFRDWLLAEADTQRRRNADLMSALNCQHFESYDQVRRIQSG
ncbi:LysR substrate-binding domain-containing protein [Paracoccus sp. Z330]|uniref:LysR substrate-binding domain-containing protein n=1 Tax=Paracoccus onchidii TaxID=3017813 RepID=A0ABT4ZGM8_9RHOB|nr:LysR substrate-binding domain-containing protein [Paracoccus onchidii]MDB6178461.1 LysR substrate-binding domain-containing protein [Paracoccus onchidii]